MTEIAKMTPKITEMLFFMVKMIINIYLNIPDMIWGCLLKFYFWPKSAIFGHRVPNNFDFAITRAPINIFSSLFSVFWSEFCALSNGSTFSYPLKSWTPKNSKRTYKCFGHINFGHINRNRLYQTFGLADS